MITSQQQETIRKAVRRFDPTLVAVFGSHARGEQHADSDLDLLVDFREPVDLLELIGLEQELSEILGIKVDLVTERSLSPLIRPYVEQDMIRID